MAQGPTRGVPIDIDGTLANNSDLLVPSQKAVVSYVTSGLSSKQNALGFTPLDRAGDTMLGNLLLSSNPTLALQAATKDYVDTLINGVDWKQSAVAGTVAALPAYTVSGSGTILTGNANGAIPSATTDGITLAVTNRVLVKNETSTLTPNNGIYVVTQVGNGSTPFILTRSDDANSPTEIAEATISIYSGSTLSNTQWHCNPASVPIVFGTTYITFAQIGSGTYTASAPISITGNIISISQATISTDGYLSSTDWNTFNSKQTQLNGTGFVKASGTTISYDSTNYLPLTGGTLSGALTLNGNLVTNALASFNSQVHIYNNQGLFLWNVGSNYSVGFFPTATITANRVLYAPDATGVIALISNLSSYQLALSGTGIVKSSSGTISYISGTASEFIKGDGSLDSSTYYLASNPSGYTSNTGTVTSVGLSLPAIFTITVSPVTTSGTLTATLATQTANTVFAGPTTGVAADPAFRALVAADIPALSYEPIITAGSITLTKIQNIAANSFLANVTGASTTVQEISTSRIPLFASAITGTASATTYLRGDGSWATVSGGGATSTYVRTSFTATASQTTFSGLTYTVGYIEVYLNGTLLNDTNDYTATNGTSVVLSVGANAGDIIETIAFSVSTISTGALSNSLVLKADSGTTEGTDLFTFDGSAAKTLNIVAGSNITITKTSGQWSIASTGGGGGMTNPMSALGDLIYGGTSGTPSSLTGNLTTTRKFLRQTGTGSASAAPVWDTILAADIPTLNQNTTGSAGSVANSFIIKADSGATEGNSLYTFDGSAGKTLNIVAGTNVTISKTTGQWTINASGGGGGGSVGGSANQVQYNDGSGGFAGAANVKIDNDDLILAENASYSIPPANTVKLIGRDIASRTLPAFVGPSGLDSALQPFLGRNKIAYISFATGATTSSGVGIAITATGTATSAVFATTNLATSINRLTYLATTASTSAVTGFRSASQNYWIGSGSGLGGFTYICRWGIGGNITTPNFTTMRAFVGLRASTTAPTDVAPNTLTNAIGMGWDSSDTNVQIYSAGTSNSKIDTGIALNRSVDSQFFELAMFSPPNTNSVCFVVTELNTTNTFTTTVTTSTNLPITTNASSALNIYGYTSAGGTSTRMSIAVASIYIETDY